MWSNPGTWSGVVDGRSSILFALLAGVSVGLLTGRTAPPTGAVLLRSRLVLLTRAALLLALGGLVQLLVVPVAVLLEYYAVLLVLCLTLLRWGPSRFFLLAVLLVAVVNPLYHQVLLPWASADTGGGGALGELTLTGTYPVLTWSAFVVTGLGVDQLDLTATRVRVGLLLVGLVLAVLGYGAGDVVGVGASSAAQAPAWVTSEGDARWQELVPPAGDLLGVEPHSNTPAETVGSGGFATADGGVGHWLLFAGTALVGCTLWAVLLGRGPLGRLVGAVTRRVQRA